MRGAGIYTRTLHRLWVDLADWWWRMRRRWET